MSVTNWPPEYGIYEHALTLRPDEWDWGWALGEAGKDLGPCDECRRDGMVCDRCRPVALRLSHLMAALKEARRQRDEVAYDLARFRTVRA